MQETLKQPFLPGLEDAVEEWQEAYSAQTGDDRDVVNRSRIPVKPLYTPLDWSG